MKKRVTVFITSIGVIMIFLFQIELYAAKDITGTYQESSEYRHTFCASSPAHPDDPHGGVLLVGFKDHLPLPPNPEEGHELLFVRIDEEGNELWHNTGPNLTGSGAFKGANWTDDGGFILVGNHIEYIRIDKDGNFLDGEPFDDMTGWYITKCTATGIWPEGFVILSDHFGDSHLHRTDADGIWLDVWFNFLPEENRYFSVKQTSDGGFICAGTILDGDYWQDFIGSGGVITKVRYDSYPDNTFGNNGTVDLSIHGFSMAFNVEERQDGGYLVTALKNDGSDKIVLIELDSKGGFENYYYVSIDGQDISSSMAIMSNSPNPNFPGGIKFGTQRLPDGTFMLGGHMNNPDVDHLDLVVCKVDPFNANKYSVVYSYIWENYGCDAHY